MTDEKPIDENLKEPAFLRKASSPAEYCRKCEYPTHGGICLNCQDERRRMAEFERLCMRMIGGAKPWFEYTPERFQSTALNAAAFEAAQAFDPKKDNLFIFGNYGTGKSHLAAIAKRRWVLRELRCKTMRLDDFYLDYRTYIKDPRRQREMLKELILVPILSIEDLGAEKETEYTTGVLWNIVDGRYLDRRAGLIITSNLSLEALALKYKNGRVSSRLYEMCRGKVFDLSKERDWRKEKKE